MSLNTLSKTLPIAHRGASGIAPENTISAIKKAQAQGVKYIEIDVHMTKDNHIVALHDSTVDRTSNGTGQVSVLNLDELKNLDFGSWFSTSYAGEKIPTLREVLNVLKDETLIIELKYGSKVYPHIEQEIVKIIKETKKSKQIILKSFNRQILTKFLKIAPELERLYCTFGGNNWITLDDFLRFKGIFEGANFHYLQVHKYFLSKKLINDAHKRGIKVIVWDVHDKKSMNEFKELGVDFIESDNPDLVNHIDVLDQE